MRAAGGWRLTKMNLGRQDAQQPGNAQGWEYRDAYREPRIERVI